MKFVIDIDGTVCTQAPDGDYSKAQPLWDNIRVYNELYNAGHTIWYYTARGTETKKDWRMITQTQFRAWGIKYHELLFGKPSADVYIDDRSVLPYDVYIADYE